MIVRVQLRMSSKLLLYAAMESFEHSWTRWWLHKLSMQMVSFTVLSTFAYSGTHIFFTCMKALFLQPCLLGCQQDVEKCLSIQWKPPGQIILVVSKYTPSLLFIIHSFGLCRGAARREVRSPAAQRSTGLHRSRQSQNEWRRTTGVASQRTCPER